MQQLRSVPIHRALNRPDLLAGCERELLLLTGLIAATLVLVALNWAAAFLGGLVWFALIGSLRIMGKADPFMSKVYLRHVRYTAFYPSKSTPFVPSFIHKR